MMVMGGGFTTALTRKRGGMRQYPAFHSLLHCFPGVHSLSIEKSGAGCIPSRSQSSGRGFAETIHCASVRNFSLIRGAIPALNGLELIRLMIVMKGFRNCSLALLGLVVGVMGNLGASLTRGRAAIGFIRLSVKFRQRLYQSTSSTNFGIHHFTLTGAGPNSERDCLGRTASRASMEIKIAPFRYAT